MVRIKICGLMSSEDVDVCARSGAHTVGFVVDYPTPVPWNLTAAKAKELIMNTPPFVSTCVVTGGSVEKVLKTVHETLPNIVQLHYKESLQEVKEITRQCKLIGIKVIKALRMSRNGNCDFELQNPAEAVKELSKTGIAAILIDSFSEALPGGTGMTVDLSVFRKLQQGCPMPLILAGGLNPKNITSILHNVSPYGVDILTGVEEKPGLKDPEKIRSFIESVNL